VSEDILPVLWREARRLTRGRLRALPPMLFFTDPERTPRALGVIARLPKGAGVVYRAFGRADALSAGRPLRAAARARGVIFLVGADPRLARRLRADGVHWPERLVSRRARRSPGLATAAAHDLKAVRRAHLARVDAIILSPIFPSRSPSAGPALGVTRLAALARATKTPVYALGGVGRPTVRRLRGSGAAGFAAIEAFDPPAAEKTRT
jgi:thiamine-phosphate pyrophosphorylase